MDAVILAGGKGTRLRPFTVSIPKPLVPLGDEPIIRILLRQLEAAGIRRVHIALGHLAEVMKAYFDQVNHSHEIEILYSVEKEALGTVGPIKKIRGLGETFLLLNGDILTTLSFEDLVDYHRRQHCILTLAVQKREVALDYGVVEVSEDSRIVGHREKPSLGVTVGMGVCVFDHRVLDYIPEDQKFDFPDLIRRLIEAGEAIAAFQSDDYWMDIGRPEDYETALRDYASSPERFVTNDKS
jgi:NDP-sugar pyrophosphorylase family protein